MKNWEKYEQEIKEIGFDFAVIKVNSKMKKCEDVECDQCCFFADNCCKIARREWLYEEYEPPKPKLTARDKAFLDCIVDWFGYIARDKNGEIYFHLHRPTKCSGEWDSNLRGYIMLDEKMFKFITWDDEEPWRVFDLKQLEVEDETSKEA